MTPNYRQFWSLVAKMCLMRSGLLKTADGPAFLVQGDGYRFEDDPESLVLL